MLQNIPSTPQKIAAKAKSVSSVEDLADLALFYGGTLTPEQQAMMESLLSAQFGAPPTPPKS